MRFSCPVLCSLTLSQHFLIQLEVFLELEFCFLPQTWWIWFSEHFALWALIFITLFLLPFRLPGSWRPVWLRNDVNVLAGIHWMSADWFWLWSEPCADRPPCCLTTHHIWMMQGFLFIDLFIFSEKSQMGRLQHRQSLAAVYLSVPYELWAEWEGWWSKLLWWGVRYHNVTFLSTNTFNI